MADLSDNDAGKGEDCLLTTTKEARMLNRMMARYPHHYAFKLSPEYQERLASAVADGVARSAEAGDVEAFNVYASLQLKMESMNLRVLEVNLELLKHVASERRAARDDQTRGVLLEAPDVVAAMDAVTAPGEPDKPEPADG